MKKIIIALTGMLLLFGASRTAQAGLHYNDEEWCYEAPDNSYGYCYGNLHGFIVARNTTDYVEFYMSGYNGSYNYWFDADYQGGYYYCDVPTSATALTGGWPELTTYGAEMGTFEVDWDANHNCNFMNVVSTTLYLSEAGEGG